MVQAVPAVTGYDAPSKDAWQQSQIPDKIHRLMPNKLVLEAQAI